MHNTSAEYDNRLSTKKGWSDAKIPAPGLLRSVYIWSANGFATSYSIFFIQNDDQNQASSLRLAAIYCTLRSKELYFGKHYRTRQYAQPIKKLLFLLLLKPQRWDMWDKDQTDAD